MAHMKQKNNWSRAIFNWMRRTHGTHHYKNSHSKHFPELHCTPTTSCSRTKHCADAPRTNLSTSHHSTYWHSVKCSSLYRPAECWLSCAPVPHYAAALSGACLRSGHCSQAKIAGSNKNIVHLLILLAVGVWLYPIYSMLLTSRLSGLLVCYRAV